MGQTEEDMISILGVILYFVNNLQEQREGTEVLLWFCETRLFEGSQWINLTQGEETRDTEPLCSCHPLSLSSEHTKDDSLCFCV